MNECFSEERLVASLVHVQDPRFGAVQFANDTIAVRALTQITAVDLAVVSRTCGEETHTADALLLFLRIERAEGHPVRSYRVSRYADAIRALRQGQTPPDARWHVPAEAQAAIAAFEAAHKEVKWW